MQEHGRGVETARDDERCDRYAETQQPEFARKKTPRLVENRLRLSHQHEERGIGEPLIGVKPVDVVERRHRLVKDMAVPPADERFQVLRDRVVAGCAALAQFGRIAGDLEAVGGPHDNDAVSGELNARQAGLEGVRGNAADHDAEEIARCGLEPPRENDHPSVAEPRLERALERQSPLARQGPLEIGPVRDVRPGRPDVEGPLPTAIRPFASATKTRATKG